MGAFVCPLLSSAVEAVLEFAAPDGQCGGGAMYLDVEVTEIEIDEDGDGVTDHEIIMVEDVPDAAE